MFLRSLEGLIVVLSSDFSYVIADVFLFNLRPQIKPFLVSQYFGIVETPRIIEHFNYYLIIILLLILRANNKITPIKRQNNPLKAVSSEARNTVILFKKHC